MEVFKEVEIQCPMCGRIETDSWEAPDNGEKICDCGFEFEYERQVEVTYNSYCKTHKWEKVLQLNTDTFKEEEYWSKDKKKIYVECDVCRITKFIDPKELITLEQGKK